MNDPRPAPPPSETDAHPAPVAVVALDSSGKITAANPSAVALWAAGPDGLIGEAFAGLFAYEVVSRDPDWLEAQWEALVGSALNQSVSLQTQPREGPAREVRVRLEPLLGPAAGYLATLQTPATAAAPATDDGAFRLLAEQGAAGFFDLNFAAGKVHFSPSWKKILGYAAGELPDTVETWHRLIHPDDSAAAPDHVAKRATAGPRPFSVEFRMQHRAGHWVWIQCTGLQVIGENHQLERVVGLHLDITDRKQVEEDALANDARLQDLSGGGPLAAFELDFAGNVFWYSPAFERLLGREEGEMEPSAAAFAGALPADEASDGVEEWWLRRAVGQTTLLETVHLTRHDGQPVPVLLGAHRSVTRRRELTRVVGFAVPLPTDFSGTGAAGDTPAAALAAEAFAALAESVIITDARGRITFLNAPAAGLLAIAPDQARGRPLGDVFALVNRQSGQPGDDPVDRALAADAPLGLISEHALARPAAGAPSTPIVWTARASFGPDNQPRGVVVVFRNPEQMTLTPDELLKANRLESLGVLAGGIAHDFNNLLTTILGAVSLAKDNRDHSALADAEQACLTAKGLTRQLLAFAKGGSGTTLVCSAKEILNDSIKIAAAASVAEITLEVADDTEPVAVDRAQILQVFQNLIVNALQAMPPPPHRPRLQIRTGNVHLAEAQLPSLPEGDYVAVEVRDNGTGISPEHVEKIFDPFFTTKKHGTGLGLATVLSLVRKHGGQLGLDTEVGQGTAFTVYLPKAGKPVEVQARKAASLRFGTGRVLFMDDDPQICALTATMLQSLDYRYDLARNGEEAITFYKRYQNIGRPYDAVIMDLTIVGGMGGEECFRALRELDPEVRAIVSSGYDNDDLANKYLAMGFCGYLTKPYRVTDLGKVLKTVLG